MSAVTVSLNDSALCLDGNAYLSSICIDQNLLVTKNITGVSDFSKITSNLCFFLCDSFIRVHNELSSLPLPCPIPLSHPSSLPRSGSSTQHAPPGGGGAPLLLSFLCDTLRLEFLAGSW